MTKLVIIEMLGRKIGFNMLSSKLYAMWKLTRSFQLMDLDNDSYIVKFQAKVDSEKALAEMVVYGQYLMAVESTIGQVVRVDDNTENRLERKTGLSAIKKETDEQSKMPIVKQPSTTELDRQMKDNMSVGLEGIMDKDLRMVVGIGAIGLGWA
ncbi:hypothetical protein Gogos_011536 [Gossypium gossypioides]|uniref:DUF4283 domain-containing protein n=1 Tax=Gossypium gossypioides TaxID=34282 RepID=A0A7J9BPL2_GOSGO|nr:hypothetical protein [Gossypium gossypioides]